MILDLRHLPFVLTAAAVLTACAAPAGNVQVKSADANSSANTAKPLAAAPTADALLALDRQANEAYIKGDGKFFESLLSDSLVMRKGGSRLSKSDFLKMISGVKCEVKAGWAVTEPQMSRIDDDTYVLTYRVTKEGSCTADGRTEKLPSPVRAATVWVRTGEQWRAAFHGENLIVDPAAPAATGKKEEPKKDDKDAGRASVASVPLPAKPTANPGTDAMMAAERAVWEAWRTHDAKKIEDLTAKEIAFVNIFGTHFADKVATLKDWTSVTCDVTSFTLTDGVGTSLSPTVGILTLKGSVVGTCGGQDISGQWIFGTSVYVKDGDAWKWAFGFNSPT